MKKLFEKFKSWRNTRKNYRNAKIVLAVNLANITTTLSNLTDEVSKLVETQKETVGSMTSEDFANLLRFTSAVQSPDFQKEVIDRVVQSIKDRDKEDHTYIEK